jgi:hypothetical protein
MMSRLTEHHHHTAQRRPSMIDWRRARNRTCSRSRSQHARRTQRWCVVAYSDLCLKGRMLNEYIHVDAIILLGPAPTSTPSDDGPRR